ncbi:MAG: 4Fe-4S binding protein, partial [Spirochaetales bacterium]|nr:4Fe-4S binding protein [Spirochaetales bacterium]
MTNIAKKNNWVRKVIQIGFFGFVFLLTVSHVMEEWGIALPFSAASLHALCPFGAVETVGRLITQGKFIPKTHESNLWIFFATAGTTVLIGAVFCSWLCPLGSIQDWVGKLGNRIFKKRYNQFVPDKLDRVLGYLRYVVLILIVIDTTRMLSLTFAKVDPYYALFHFWTGEALISAIIVLLIVLAASLFIERPWCRWLCPFGAVLGLLQLIAPWKIRRNTDLCTSGGLCTKACPLNIDV